VPFSFSFSFSFSSSFSASMGTEFKELLYREAWAFRWADVSVPGLSWVQERQFQLRPEFSLSGLIFILYGRWVALYVACLVSWACHRLGTHGFPWTCARLTTTHTYTNIALLLCLQRWHDPGADARRAAASVAAVGAELAELQRAGAQARQGLAAAPPPLPDLAGDGPPVEIVPQVRGRTARAGRAVVEGGEASHARTPGVGPPLTPALRLQPMAGDQTTGGSRQVSG